MPEAVMYQWTDQMIGFMKDASSYSDYYKSLACLLEPYLKDCLSICDCGCGLGNLGMELAKFNHKVVCADICQRVLDVAETAIENSSLENIKTWHCDLMDPGLDQKFDCLVFSYFGSIEEIMDITGRLCLKRALIIKKDYQNHRFSYGVKPIIHNSGEKAINYLKDNNIKFETLPFRLEFGQPFRKTEDAVEFYRIYSRDLDKSLITRPWVQSKLVRIDNREFSYYLPHEKASKLIIINTEDLRNG